MTILVTLATVAALAVAITTFSASIFFWVACKRKEDSWKNEVPLQKEVVWELERRRTRWALVSIFGYALAMLISMLLKNYFEASQPLTMILVGAGSASILIMSLRAMVHNNRSFEASLDRTNPNRPPY